ncbi:MAG: YqgE/AlgH family protein [Bacteroidia bacterium]|nr:YqgE/AlgH family protein [Bacteroidia bacterium]
MMMTELKRLFEVKTNLDPAAGRLLVANPLLDDPNFRRSVVLLTEYGPHGAMGFILNYPIETDMIPGLPPLEFELRCGGPVGEDSLFVIHNNENISGAVKICNGLYIGGDLRDLQNANAVAFLGYSGWGKRQLEQEIRENTWAVCEADPNDVFFSNADTLWEEVMCRIGDRHAYMTLFPKNPRLN